MMMARNCFLTEYLQNTNRVNAIFYELNQISRMYLQLFKFSIKMLQHFLDYVLKKAEQIK